MKRRVVLFVSLLILITTGFAQTNPLPQALPFSFTSQSGSSLPAGMAVHRFGTAAGSIPITRILTPGNGDLPFTSMNTSGGWTDNGVNGIGILASGSQAAGAFIVSINTTAKSNIQINWTIRLILQQTARDNSIALQYRIGNTGNFTDIGTATTYNSTGQVVNHSLSFSETLPAAAENQPEVQLRWIYWESAGSTGSRDRLAIDEISIATAVVVPPCTEPATQPANLTLTPTPSTISGTFDAAVPAADEYLIVRSTSAVLGAVPSDGSVYTAGQAFGSGTVISIGSGTSFTDINLASSTHYYYFVFAANSDGCSGGPNYLTTLNAPPTGNTNDVFTLAPPACTTPAAIPSGLVLNPANTFISGSFTAAAGANYYLTVISSSNSLSAAPVDGVTYTPGSAFGGGTVVSYGTSTIFSASGLSTNTTYYLFVFGANGECTGEPFYNTTSLNGTATTTNVAGPPPNYYTAADGLTCQPLKTALKNIISSGTQVLSYSPGLWNLYAYSDMHRNDANTADIIWDMYSDNPTGPEPYTYTYGADQCGSYTVEGDCYNREHSTPQSFFAEASPMKSDAHHVFPTDGKVNGVRDNYPYGKVTSVSFVSGNGSKLGTGNNYSYTGTVFEPIDAYKGDLARAVLYMATRYEDEIISQNWSSNSSGNDIFLSTGDQSDAAKRRLNIYDSWFLKTMIDWHIQDPVSQKELDRNNTIFYQEINDGGLKRQGNRNPYVDHPEYVALVWQCSGVLPVTIIDFTAQKNNASVLLKWYATFESNFKTFGIERGTDGVSFTQVGEVAGRNLANYFYTDNTLPKANTVYYRLKMTDANGSYRYSKIVAVRIDGSLPVIKLYPNPTTAKLIIELEDATGDNGLLSVTDIAGRKVLAAIIPKGQKLVPLNTAGLAAGRYFISIISGNSIVSTSFVVIK